MFEVKFRRRTSGDLASSKLHRESIVCLSRRTHLRANTFLARGSIKLPRCLNIAKSQTMTLPCPPASPSLSAKLIHTAYNSEAVRHYVNLFHNTAPRRAGRKAWLTALHRLPLRVLRVLLYTLRRKCNVGSCRTDGSPANISSRRALGNRLCDRFRDAEV